MSRWVSIWFGVLLLAVLAAGLTESALAFGRFSSTADDLLLRPTRTSTPQPTLSAAPTPTPVPSVASTPVPATPTPTPNVATATTNSFVHLRASNSTSSAILTDLNGGTQVVLLPYRDAQWQKVQYGSITGYIFTSYLTY